MATIARGVARCRSSRCNFTRSTAVTTFRRQFPKNLLLARSFSILEKLIFEYYQHVSVYHKLREEPDISTDSFILDVLILSEQHQRPAARCVEDIVVYNYQAGAKIPLPAFMLDMFQQTWKVQEQAKEQAGMRIRTLHQAVERLEKQSWDREGAVEDLGGGG